MTDDFATRVYPVFQYVLNALERIRTPEAAEPTPEELSPVLRRHLGQFEVEGSRKREFELAKAALIYWIDEVLSNSTWRFASQWNDQTLERQFYNTRDRAWKFFEKARIARTLPRLDALETYFLCVCFGFVGLYRDRASASGAAAFSPSDTLADPPPLMGGKPHSSSMDLDDWFNDDNTSIARETWGIGGDPHLLQSIEDGASILRPLEPRLEDFPSKLPPDVEKSLPATLNDWLESVAAQLAPEGNREFVPAGAVGSLGDASPLGGKTAQSRSVRILVTTFIITVILAVIKFAIP